MAERKPNNDGKFRLVVPLDASGVEGFKPDQKLKVVVQHSAGDEPLLSETEQLNDKGQGQVRFNFSERPGSLRVIVGPAEATDEEMLGMQTINIQVSGRQFLDRSSLTLAPIHISAYYWFWWRRWCRTFTIRGRVLCPDGSPVPGAEVCAFDVDYWWYWSGWQKVGCATTDASGAFELKFRWCCGWWPWWWWRHRLWQLEPTLVARIVPVLQRELNLTRLAAPNPKPNLAVFEELLAEEGIPSQPSVAALEPAMLDDVRERLLTRLPIIPELEQLHIWPWWPWRPWWDCTPDIIFRVTQKCQGEETLIVNETYGDTRWNIPTELSVTLVANDQACCIDPTPQPEGNCINITHVCNDPVATIGGNLSAPIAPEGYLNPGLVSIYGDRPYAGSVAIRGDFGTLTGADYYEFEWFNDDPAVMAWEAMPIGTIAGFNRSYYGPQLPAGPVDTHSVLFKIDTIDGRNVIESRQHFEANNGAGSWEIVGPGSRWWMDHKDYLAIWQTHNTIFADGSFQLRVKSWQRAGNNLVNPQILTQCGSDQLANGLILTTDNRIVGLGSGHPPSTPSHPVGADTVHTETLEPDTDFISVKFIRGDEVIAIEACDAKKLRNDDLFVVDFFAHDPDGHLAYYTLKATFGESGMVNILSFLGMPGVTLTPLGGAPVPPAAQVGPFYGHGNPTLSALDQGAVSPTWHGGAMRLRVPATMVFKKSCCYQLELRAYKRTIGSCGHNFGHNNLSEYSFMIEV